MFDRALAFLKNGDAEMAEQLCCDILLDYPKDANVLCLSGRALIKLGRHADAEERLRDAASIYPTFPRPHVYLGEMFLAQGKFENAIKEFRRAVELGDTDSNTRIKLGRALTMHGDGDSAREALSESMQLSPDRQMLIKAFELENTGKEQEAEKIYRNMLARDAENVEAMRLLAGIATKQNQHRNAETLLNRVIELAPDFGKALANLVVNQLEQEKVTAALGTAKRLTRVAADNPDSHLYLGSAYSAAALYKEAIDAYKKALRLAPTHPGALAGIAHSYRTIGRKEDAIKFYRKCIDTNPFFTETYWSLANLKTFRFTDTEFQTMEEMVKHPDIPDESQVHLYNALGLEHENRENYDRAFECFAKCNAVRRRQEYYDPAETEMVHDDIVEIVTEKFVNQPTADVGYAAAPIFIIGLPRSGSTLLEQILASHSMVEGTHELSDLGRVINQLPRLIKKNERYPKSLLDLDVQKIGQMGQAYMERTSQYRSGSPFFTDKNPNNFAHVGLVHLILPQAIFINARRHPLDSCLGSFKQLFAKGQTFSYDLTELGDYYVQYCRLMDHWNNVLPGKVLDVHYEDVVADLDTQVHRILDHCGLPFEEQCLTFHETDRAVKTASSEQVRQPIYSTSVNLWRNYESHLGPVIDILAPLLRKMSAQELPDKLAEKLSALHARALT
jgi:tetratricopeptide (TPR) repeat protein